MAATGSPTIARRRLRLELRRLREAAGRSMADVTRTLDWSMSKLIRIENGSVSISVTDLRALLDCYATPDATVEDLVALARTARERPWWSQYRELLSPAVQECIGYEADASRLRVYHPSVVPDLLQSEEYARALIAAVAPAADLDALVEVRLRRQREILGGPAYVALVDEAALRRPVGGIGAARAQLEHLVGVPDHPRVSLSVLPFAAGAHAGLLGGFQLMDFADEADASLLAAENALGELVIREGSELVTEFGAQLDRMLALAMHGHEAVDFVHRLAKELG